MYFFIRIDIRSNVSATDNLHITVTTAFRLNGNGVDSRCSLYLRNIYHFIVSSVLQFKYHRTVDTIFHGIYGIPDRCIIGLVRNTDRISTFETFHNIPFGRERLFYLSFGALCRYTHRRCLNRISCQGISGYIINQPEFIDTR